MQLYSGTSRQFIEDAVQNQVAEKLRAAFLDYYRYRPSDQEVRSWQNSLSKVKDVFERAKLLDHGVILEYQLPLTSRRLDCLITGANSANKENAVILELKQWEKCEATDSENEVETWVGGAHRPVLHPSVQVRQYQMYLEDGHTAFHEGDNPIGIRSCSYLHNYSFSPEDPLLVPKFKSVISESPLFSKDDVDGVTSFLTETVGAGRGMPILERIQNSKFRASKKLMEHVASMIENRPEYVLLDEQLVVFDRVLAAAKRGREKSKKTVILVRGGPGTGKSVIAINLMARLSKEGLQTHYSTGSKAFTETLRKIIGARGSSQFKYFNSYGTAEPETLDVLILDEAHRIRTNSANRFTPKIKRTGTPQIDELLRASKVCVFFIDDIQVVRPAEIGSSELIRAKAAALGCHIEEYQLEAQFRCAGSEGFVNWVDNTLEVRKTANTLWRTDEKFEFRVFDSALELEKAIRRKVAEGSSARMTAGYCWPWSKPKEDRTLEADVVIGDYRRPWNARPDSGRLAKGIPNASLWATLPGGIDQVGCVYTAQGFEFDYVGVIVADDLIYDFGKASWVGVREKSKDRAVRTSRDRFLDLIKSTYRVLLTRGLKGCYVYFMDEDTRKFVTSRIEGQSQALAQPTETALVLTDEPAEKLRYVRFLPVYSLAAAAGGFSEEQAVLPLGWTEINLPIKLSKELFVAKVIGASMEPTIPNGSYCIFRANPAGSREGKVVLVESRLVADPETSSAFTVKRYHSEKEFFDDGTWRHKRITLTPDNSDFQPITLEKVDAHLFKVSAEFVCTI